MPVAAVLRIRTAIPLPAARLPSIEAVPNYFPARVLRVAAPLFDFGVIPEEPTKL
jgi:hypothetical protein